MINLFSTEKIAKGVVVALLSALFIMMTYRAHDKNQNCEGGGDQGPFLNTAIWLSEHGGVANFLPLCFTGEYDPVANQNPLLVLLLSRFAKRDIHFFIKSKILSTVIAFIFYIVFFVIVKKEFGFSIAAIGVGLLITSSTFINFLSLVLCEYLLMIFTFLTWYFTTKGFRNNKLWIWAGVFNGVAMMTKASALLLLPIFALSSLIIGLKNKNLKKIFNNKYFALYFLAFFLVSFPLLTRNIVAHNNPFYSFHGRTIWLDNWSQHLNPELMEKAGMVTYLKTHSLEKIAKRLLYGTINQFRVLQITFNRSPLLGQFLHIGQYSILFILAMIFMIAKEDDLYRKIYNFVFMGVFYLILSFYAPIAARPRFFMPIVSVLIVYSSIGVNSLLEGLLKRITPHRYFSNNLVIILIAALLSLACLSFANKITFNKNLSEMYFIRDQKLNSWMRTNLKKSDVVLQHPGLEYNMYTILKVIPPMEAKIIHTSQTQNFSKLQEQIYQKNVTHFAVNIRTFSRFLLRLFKGYLERIPAKGLHVRKTPPGWKLIYSDPDPPVDFLLFEVNK